MNILKSHNSVWNHLNSKKIIFNHLFLLVQNAKSKNKSNNSCLKKLSKSNSSKNHLKSKSNNNNSTLRNTTSNNYNFHYHQQLNNHRIIHRKVESKKHHKIQFMYLISIAILLKAFLNLFLLLIVQELPTVKMIKQIIQIKITVMCLLNKKPQQGRFKSCRNRRSMFKLVLICLLSVIKAVDLCFYLKTSSKVAHQHKPDH